MSERCVQPIINQITLRPYPCGRLPGDPIHPEGAHKFEGGEIGDRINHAFRAPQSTADPTERRAGKSRLVAKDGTITVERRIGRDDRLCMYCCKGSGPHAPIVKGDR